MRRKRVGQYIVSVTVLVAVMFVMTSSATQAFFGLGAPTGEGPLVPTDDTLPEEDLEFLDDAPSILDATSDIIGEPVGTGIGDSELDLNGTSILDTFDVTPPLDFDPAKNTGDKDKKIEPLTSIKRLTFLTSGNDPLSITINLVNTALGFLGIISTVLLAYAGVLWFTARGNDEQVEKAKELIKGSLIGLVLTLMALSIAILVFNLIASLTIAG